jgi:hypothetical protein
VELLRTGGVFGGSTDLGKSVSTLTFLPGPKNSLNLSILTINSLAAPVLFGKKLRGRLESETREKAQEKCPRGRLGSPKMVECIGGREERIGAAFWRPAKKVPEVSAVWIPSLFPGHEALPVRLS